MATKKNTTKATNDSQAAAPAAAAKAAEVQTEAAKPEAAQAAAPKAPAKGGMLREITPRPQPSGNPYLPMPATVAEVIQETGNIRTLRVVLDDDDAMKKPEAIIRSMTKRERRNPGILNASRRKRIAAGSGTTVQDVNALMRQFEQAKSMMKQMMGGRRGGKKGRMRMPF